MAHENAHASYIHRHTPPFFPSHPQAGNRGLMHCTHTHLGALPSGRDWAVEAELGEGGRRERRRHAPAHHGLAGCRLLAVGDGRRLVGAWWLPLLEQRAGRGRRLVAGGGGGVSYSHHGNRGSLAAGRKEGRQVLHDIRVGLHAHTCGSPQPGE